MKKRLIDKMFTIFWEKLYCYYMKNVITVVNCVFCTLYSNCFMMRRQYVLISAAEC